MTWRTAISINIWVNYHDLTSFSLTIIKVSKENHPKMAARFRLVKYYNLPRLVKLGQIWKDIKHILQKRERERGNKLKHTGRGRALP